MVGIIVQYDARPRIMRGNTRGETLNVRQVMLIIKVIIYKGCSPQLT
jgi:hypothetical protein